MNDRLYWWLLDSPILGFFVKGRAIVLRPPNYFVVRHHRFNMYWRDPYNLRADSAGHLAQWGKLKQAWRFSTEEIAMGVLFEMSENGVIESYPYPD